MKLKWTLLFCGLYFAIGILACEKKSTSLPSETILKKSESPSANKSEELTNLFLMANFFSQALDQSLIKPDLLKEKFCSIEPEQITQYSMAVKARIDAWLQNKQLTDLPAVEQCAQNCLCDFYIDIDDKLVADLKQRESIKQVALVQQKLQNGKQCLTQLENFCESADFNSLKKDIAMIGAQ
jgi:hypothetical protein